MGIKQKSVARNSRVGTETFHLYVSDSGGADQELPIAIMDCLKVELVELGVAVTGTFTGTGLAAALYSVGDGGYTETTNDTEVATSSSDGDVGAAENWGVTRFDPPTVITPDYTAAATKFSRGNPRLSVGSVKLALRPKEDTMTTYTGWVWATLRIWRPDDG